MRIIRLHHLIMATLVLGCAWGRAFDPSLPAGGTFDPFLLALKPAVQMSPLPAWMESPARIDPEG